MSDIYKLQYNGMTLAYPGWNGFLQYENPMVGYPITYLSDEHVSLTGDQIYIPGSEGITLDSGYDTYYRISGYDITGGSIVDGKLVATGPCTIKAVEKINYFTAIGNFEKGSNVTNTYNKKTVIPAKYALHSTHTGDIPTSWYSVSERWYPIDPSAYTVSCKVYMKFSGWNYNQSRNGVQSYQMNAYVGSTTINTQYTNIPWRSTSVYNKSFNSNLYNGNLYMSGFITGDTNSNPKGWPSTGYYLATATTGTWTATGIAP